MRILTRSAALLLALSFSGCTLLGAGVGAGIDAAVPGPYRELPDGEGARVPRLEKDQHVVIHRRSGAAIEGHYVTAHGPTARDSETYLVIDAGERAAVVPLSDVRSIAVEVSGRGWLYGTLAGAAVDVAVIVAFAVFYQGPGYGDMHLAGGDSGCFC